MKLLKLIFVLLMALTINSCNKNNDSLVEDESTRIVDTDEESKASDYRGYMLALVEKLDFEEGDARRDSLLAMIDSDAERFFIGGDSYRNFLITILEEMSFYDFSKYPFFIHHLWISFQDASGNDLLEESEYVWVNPIGNILDDPFNPVRPQHYTLDIIFEEGISNPNESKNSTYVKKGTPYSDINYNVVNMVEDVSTTQVPLNPDYKCLSFYFRSYADTSDFSEKITLRLTCPYLFGDNQAHDIFTWWKPHLYESGEENAYAYCYRLEFEGKEFSVERDNKHPGDFSVVILDR